MAHEDALQERLIGQLQDAYAMENQIAEVLEKQIKSTKQYPDIQTRIQEHLEATKQHRARMEQRIRAYGKSPSPVKGLLSNLVGNMQGALGGTRTHELMMNARDDYVIEHYEIAIYGIIITIAQLAGDEETIVAANENLRDEMAMAQWLQHHISEATYLSLQEDGISISSDTWQRAQQRLESSMQSTAASWQPGQTPGVEASPTVF